ncbi:hypothetical protein EG327_010601 [Venturia inaequalis]|uniref:Uncharacterized protein n=1 Tax=Venturia inaequalis TaxID=5025 RepID=A0A8H3VS03_VENIN|nr:hypothetical protein EG327_010601 [Venturia inaequalis]
MRKLNRDNECTICITKNAGPMEGNQLTGNAIKDSEMPTYLEEWFNQPEKSSGQNSDTEFSNRMVAFWQLRLQCYQRTVDNKQREWSSSLSGSGNALRDFYVFDNRGLDNVGTSPVDGKKFDHDYEYALCAEEEVDGEQYHLYRDIYQRRMTDGSGRDYYGPLAKKFYTIIKHVKLLNTIDTMMDIFRRFRTFLRQTDAKVRVGGFRDPGRFTADAKAIPDAMGKWTPIPNVIPPQFYTSNGITYRENNNGEHEQEFKGHVKLAQKTLDGRGSVPRNFHCELQLMDRFLDDDGVYNYIGCSKRCCWLCWEILAGTRFVTQGTHCTLHWACAFAFTAGHSPACRMMVRNFGEVAGYVEKARNSLASKFPGEMYMKGVPLSQMVPLSLRLRGMGL